MRPLHLTAFGLAAALVTSFALASPADAKRKKPASCATVTGEGVSITEAIARASASTSLDQVAARVGGKRTGKITTKCTKGGLGGIMDTCQSTQRVCK